MAQVVRRPRRRRSPARASWAGPSAVALGGVALGAALLLVALRLTPDPAPEHVPVVTIENTGERAVTVRVRAVDGRSSIALGRVPAGGRVVFHEVLDLGAEWMVMLRYGNVSAGELRVSREELVEGWEVPAAVTSHFGPGGAAASG